MAYGGIRGVRHTLWTDSDEDEPSVDNYSAELEEMYVDEDRLVIRIITDEGGHSFYVPILHNDDWVDLVERLPTW